MFTAYLAKQWTFATPGLYGESCVHIPDAELAPAWCSSVFLSPAQTWVGPPRRAARQAGGDRS